MGHGGVGTEVGGEGTEGMGTEMGGWGMEGMGTEEVLCWKQGLVQTRAAAGRGRWHSHGWVSPSFVFS